MKTFKITIEGRVQGVGFRYFARQKAWKYGVKGCVENDFRRGGVELFCQGKVEEINKFVEEVCKGPILANVVKVNIEEKDEEPYSDFIIK